MPARRRINTDFLGSPRKSYKEDSWDESEMAFDLGGNQRSPDEDAPEFYTLGSAGMIDARIENMEVFSLEDGSKDPQSSDEQVAELIGTGYKFTN
jgi:hypothetical protein